MIVPADAVTGRFSGRKLCAAQPTKSARAGSVRNRRLKTVAGSTERRPNRAIRPDGSETARADPARLGPVRRICHQGPEDPPPCIAFAPSPSAVRPATGRAVRAEPLSSGIAKSISGQRQLQAVLGERQRRQDSGDATPNGWTAEQTSCCTPGRVSSLVRVPPPISSAASSTVTEGPRWARVTPRRARWARPDDNRVGARRIHRAGTFAARGVQVRYTGRSCVPRLPADHVRHPDISPLELAGRGVDKPVLLARRDGSAVPPA